MTHHTWRHVTFWLLLLGVFWLPLPTLTADLNAACETYADGKFKIRAMIYTSQFAYLVDSDGQLFVEHATTFLDGIDNYPTTIKLSKPIFSLPTKWHDYPLDVNYGDTGIQFGFINEHPHDSRQDRRTLGMITYLELRKAHWGKLDICVNDGFQMNGREEPSRFERKRYCKRIESSDRPAFWLNDMWTMYPIKLLAGGTKMIVDEFDTLYK